MLLPDNIHPENCIYYNGAIVLKALQAQSSQNLLELFQNIRLQQNMTFPVFVLCLDWLFLLNLAILNENGEVKLCF
jgi:hypothetical protein